MSLECQGRLECALAWRSIKLVFADGTIKREMLPLGTHGCHSGKEMAGRWSIKGAWAVLLCWAKGEGL